jgi:hypothetical protein
MPICTNGQSKYPYSLIEIGLSLSKPHRHFGEYQQKYKADATSSNDRGRVRPEN